MVASSWRTPLCDPASGSHPSNREASHRRNVGSHRYEDDTFICLKQQSLRGALIRSKPIGEFHGEAQPPCTCISGQTLAHRVSKQHGAYPVGNGSSSASSRECGPLVPESSSRCVKKAEITHKGCAASGVVLCRSDTRGTPEQARKHSSPKKNHSDKQVSSWRHISCHTDKNRYYT